MKIRHLTYFIMLNFINQRAYFQRISYNFNEVLILNKGQKDDLNLMDKQAMNLIRGGVECKKNILQTLVVVDIQDRPINVTNENKRVVMMQLYGSLVC